MEKQFQDYLMEELKAINIGVTTLTTEFQEYKTAAAEKYVTKGDCATCAKDKKDGQKGVFGWIIGAYAFIMSVAIAMFTTILKK